MFNVICIETGTVVAEGIATGAEAAALAAAHTETSGKRHQPRRVVAPNAVDWRERERARFADGTYTTVPWAYASWIQLKPELADHFVHVSIKKPGLVAYTPDAEKGVADRQVPIKPGAYLTEHWADVLNAEEIKTLANQFVAQYAPCELHFADTADEIERVYTHGPSSCMSHEADYYDSPLHPVRVYAAGDIAVAYVTDPDNAETISARALCRPAKKLYSRIYGEETRLSAALQRAGYSFSDTALVGARLLRVRCDHGGFVAPYIDYCATAEDNGEYLVITRHGDLDCGRTDGLTDPAHTCGHCNEVMDEDDCYTVGDEQWCESCYSRYASYCEHCDTTAQMNVSGVQLVTRRGTRRTESWCNDCIESDAFSCVGSNLTWHEDQRVTLEDGTEWSKQYFEDHGATCDSCGGMFPGVDVTEHNNTGVYYCGECLPDSEDEEDADDAQPCAEYCQKPHARQGRDENEAQTELALSKPSKPGLLAVGDVVNVRWPVEWSHLSPGPHTIVSVDEHDAALTYEVTTYQAALGLYNTVWVNRDWIVPDDAPAKSADQTQPAGLAVGDMVNVRWPSTYGERHGSYQIVETAINLGNAAWLYRVGHFNGYTLWVHRDWIVPNDVPVATSELETV